MKEYSFMVKVGAITACLLIFFTLLVVGILLRILDRGREMGGHREKNQ
jgi:hypothetical protein